MKEDSVHRVKSLSSILCVVDFSESTKKSIEWSVQMALLLNLHITILHTFRLLEYTKGEVLLMKRRKEDESTNQFIALEKVVLIDKKISYDFRTEVGFLADRVDHFTMENITLFVVVNKSMMSENKETFQELLSSVRVPFVIVP